MQVHVSNWITYKSSYSHPEALACPSTPEMLQAKERAPTPSPSAIFTCRLVIESIKELGGASQSIYPMLGYVIENNLSQFDQREKV